MKKRFFSSPHENDMKQEKHTMEQFIKILTAFGILAGVIDMILKNRWKLGDKFQQGFSMMGSMMISMVGILVIAPAAASFLKNAGAPFFRALNIDPSILSIFFSNDMGGYALSQALAEDPAVGLMFGMITAGMFGTALTFTIPLGFGVLEEEVIPNFSKGALFGLGCIPVGNLIGGLFLGIPFLTIIWNSIPVILLSVLIIIGMIRIPAKMIKFMEFLALLIKFLGLAGIVFGCLDYLLNITVIPNMDSLMDSMLLVCQMTITIIGMLPVMELVTRLFKKPLTWFGERLGLDVTSISGLLLSLVSCTPVFPMMKRMNTRGQILNSTWAVLIAGVFGSQLGLAMSACPEAVPALLAGKLAAGITGMIVVLLCTSYSSSGFSSN